MMKKCMINNMWNVNYDFDKDLNKMYYYNGYIKTSYKNIASEFGKGIACDECKNKNFQWYIIVKKDNHKLFSIIIKSFLTDKEKRTIFSTDSANDVIEMFLKSKLKIDKIDKIDKIKK